MRQRMLTTLGRWAAEKTWWMLLFVVVLTGVFADLSGRLELSMDLTSLLPSDDPMVDEFNYIMQEFNGASSIFLVVEGETDDMVAYAEHVSPMIENLEGWIGAHGSDAIQAEHQAMLDNFAAGKNEYEGRYIERVEYKQPIEFMRDHALMLVKPSDMETTGDMYTDPNLLPLLTNLNNSLEKEYIQSDDKLSSTQQELSAVGFLDGIESWVDLTRRALIGADYNSATAAAAAEALAIGPPYFSSPDRSMLIIMIEPTFNIMDLNLLLPGINGLEELVKSEAGKFGVTAGLAGSPALGRDEYVAGMEDSFSLTMYALLAILVLFIITFRMLSSPLLAMLNLIIGITWAMGISYLLVDSLNLMTAMMAIVLVGLGIDFSIHIISVFSELTNQGVPPQEAIVSTLQKVGAGIITGAVSTSAAFLTLLIGRSAGISEFGLVCGVGLLMIMVATFLALPMMLMLREKYRDWRGKELKAVRDVSYSAVGNLTEKLYNRWRFSLTSMLLVTVFFGWMMTKVTMDYNYLNMEPVGLESIELADKLIDKFNFSPDVTLLTARSLEENQAFTEKAKDKPHVSFVESITDYMPLLADQQARRAGILTIAETMGSAQVQNSFDPADWEPLLGEFQRLEMNIMELQTMAFLGGQDNVDAKATRLVGDPDNPATVGRLSDFIAEMEAGIAMNRLAAFNGDFGAAFKEIVLDMADTSTITQDMLPALIQDKHISVDGSRYLLTLYPKGNVWDMEYLEAFATEVLDITRSIAGTPPMFYFLLKQIGEDGRRASLLTLLVVFLFLWADFRSLRYAAMAMLPLVFGIIWMTGIMGLFGVQITLLNIIAIPLIIGIGIDDGVHILHRYQLEGIGSVNKVYRSTGKAIIITSLTTMLAFGSLVFATYRGFGSMGLALFIGVGACLATSLLILPGVLRVMTGNTKAA